MLMVVCGVLGLGLAGCGPTNPGYTTPGIVTPPPADQPGQSGTEYPSIPTPGGKPIGTPTYDCTPTPLPTPIFKNWLPDKFRITHYAIVRDDDPFYTNRTGNIPIYRMGEAVTWEETPVYDFVVGRAEGIECDLNCRNWSVYVQGSGKITKGDHSGQYLHTLIDSSLFPPGFQQHAVYEYLDSPPCACATYIEKEATIAVSADALQRGVYHCGDKYYIDGYDDKVFTVTDTGSFGDEEHFDIYVGEQFFADFQINYPQTGGFRRVAKVQ